MNARALEDGDFAAIHRAFGEAFGDYAVPFQLTPEQLREMLRRRGWSPEASVGVFDGERLVAFTLNGVGTWRGVRTGYDTGTGVVPSHRGRGLSRRMIDESIDRLRHRGAAQYLLEVLQENRRAFDVYRGAGFEVTRELQCWACEPPAGTPEARVVRLDDPDWTVVSSFFDVQPSWQNSIDSVRRAGAPRTHLGFTRDGALDGIAVVFESGDLPFVAGHPATRRRGVGRALLAAASRAAGRPLRILNVEGEYAAEFLQACGAQRTVRQYEMLRAL